MGATCVATFSEGRFDTIYTSIWVHFFGEVRFLGPSSVFKKSHSDTDQWEERQAAPNQKSDSGNNAYARPYVRWFSWVSYAARIPSEIVRCVLCDRRNWAARSKFAKLTISERQEKIYERYKKRNGYSLNHWLMNKKIHISCYNTFTFGLDPVTTVNKTGRPKINSYRRRWSLKNASPHGFSLSITTIENRSHQNKRRSNIAKRVIDLNQGHNHVLSSESEVRYNQFFPYKGYALI